MRNLLIVFILLILCSSSAFAISATILTGLIQINVDSAPAVFQKSIGVKNDNNVSVDVSFVPSDDIKTMVSMETYNLSLGPGEQRFVKFNLTVPDLKEYRSNIKTIFSVPGSNRSEDRFGLATMLVILPKTNSTSQDNSSSVDNATQEIPNNQTGGDGTPLDKPSSAARYWLLGLAALVIVILAAILIIKHKAGAKNE